LLSVLALVALCGAASAASGYKRVCYYTNWAQYRPGAAKYWPEDIDPHLCTHVIYSFAKIARGELAMYEWNDDKVIPRVMALKKQNPDLKVLWAVGGWNHENGKPGKFSQMVATPEGRKKFIDSTLRLLKKFEFDGFDLDWEYPANRGNSPPGDKQRFTLLCQELLAAFKKEAKESGKPRMLLTAAVAAGYKTIRTAYDIPGIAASLDWINLMAYDLNGQWNGVTGHHTGMSSNDHLDVPYAVDFWMKGGMPANKIALGMGTYGRAFKLKDESNFGIGAPKHDWEKAAKGRFTRESGFLAYFEICTMGLKVVNDPKLKAPYGHKGRDWVGYDDRASLTYKVNHLIKKLGMAGAMFWALDLDDFKGQFCNEGKYPLMTAVYKALENGELPPTSKPGPVTQPPRTNAPPTAGPGPDTPAPPTQPPRTPGKGECRGKAPWNNPNTDAWCKANCPAYCPASHCICD